MTTTTPATTTLEPAKRILRTVIVIIIAILSVLVYIIGHTHFASPTLVLIAGQVLAVAVAFTGFFATPAGNWLLSWIGLSATAVAKEKADATALATVATPVLTATVAAAEAPTVGLVEAVADATVAAAAPALADATAVAADVTDAAK